MLYDCTLMEKKKKKKGCINYLQKTVESLLQDNKGDGQKLFWLNRLTPYVIYLYLPYLALP